MRGLLTAADVARLLKLHPNSVYRLVRDGALVATRVRGSLRFTESDVQAFVERQRAVPARMAKRVPNTPPVALPPGMHLDDVNPLTGRLVRDDLAAWGY